ncbi:MAG: ferritin-like domain-containing protein [Candidatus Bathyarchaeota archaeon]
MSDTVKKLQEQKELEVSHIKSLTPLAEKTGHPLVKVVLQSVIHDSGKHASICQALIDVNAGEPPFKLDLDMAKAVELHQNVKQHIRVESKMITRLETMVKEAEDDRVAELLSYMLEDERRHHRLLTGLSNLLDRDEAALDEYMKLFQTFMIIPPE